MQANIINTAIVKSLSQIDVRERERDTAMIPRKFNDNITAGGKVQLRRRYYNILRRDSRDLLYTTHVHYTVCYLLTVISKERYSSLIRSDKQDQFDEMKVVGSGDGRVVD